jgi:signal transduction histidine kinase/ligand-binding sensor domain-containing protein
VRCRAEGFGSPTVEQRLTRSWIATLVCAPMRCALVLISIAAPTAPAYALDSGPPSSTELPTQAHVSGELVRLGITDTHDIRFSHLARAQGLSQTRITQIVQDDQGFIWFGTQYGLNRYDGYRFKVFKPDPERPASICGVYINSLFKARDGTLWIGCDYEVDRYDPALEAFSHYRIDPAVPGLSNSINHIAQDGAGRLWFSTRTGLYRIDPRTGTSTHFWHNPEDAASLSSDDVYSTGEDRRGGFWAATSGGLDELDPATGRVSLHVPIREPRQMSFYEDREGVFWILYSSGNGLAVLDRDNRQLIRYSFGERDLPSFPLTGVSSILEDHEGTLWFGTYADGLLRFDREHQRFNRYRYDPTDADSLSENRITTLFEDRERTIWVGLGATEPSFFSSSYPTFSKLPFDWKNQANLGETLVNTIYQDSKGSLWIGTTGALTRFNRSTGETVHFDLGPPGVASDVLSIVEDRAGTLWAGTSGQGLARLDAPTGRLQMYRHAGGDPSSISNDTVPALFVGREGRLWAATLDGLDEVDPASGRFVAYRHSPEGRAADYYSIAQGRQNELWIGAGTVGLLRFDPDTHQFKLFSKPQLGDVRANSVYVSKSGIVWTGTQNGLSGMNPDSGVITSYSEKDGMASSAVSCILEDDAGDLWMGTTAGLSRLTPATKSFKNYSLADGLPGPDLTGWSACSRSASGEMFFGGFAGAVAFYPDQVKDSAYLPPIVLTAFELFGVPVVPGSRSPLQQAIGFTDALTLPHDQNSFSLQFSALSFSSPSTNRYRYRLDGLDSDWHEAASDQRKAVYTTLPPGNYEFRVQGATIRGPWSEPGKRVHITILPPWWATWWFRASAVAALLLMLWTAYHRHLHRIKQELEIRVRERVSERTRIARELHDSLLQGFQGLMFRLQAVRDLLPGRPDEAAAALETALDRGDETITDAREAVQDLRSSNLVGGDLEHAQRALGEELGSPETSFRVLVEGRPHSLAPLQRDEIYRIAREASRNAARHSNARNIEVEIEYGDSSFSLRVRDDGDGIDREVLARGRRAGHWGLQGMRERAEQMGGRLSLWSERKAGTEVELTIPASVAYGLDSGEMSSSARGTGTVSD